jgi:hypothetical protein
MRELDNENANSNRSEWKTTKDDEGCWPKALSQPRPVQAVCLSVSADATPRGAHGGMLIKGDFLGVGGVAAMLSGSPVGDACHRKLERSRMRLQDQARRYLQIQVNRLGEVRARRLKN